MAGIAGSILVGAPQWKLRLAVMVEADSAPVGGTMASLAFLAETAAMHIFKPVAADALARRFLVAFTHMTGGTHDLAMPSCQWKLGCLIVIEAGFSPGPFSMTVGAARAEAALVPVVSLVTGEALAGSLAEFGRRYMAGLACRSLVGVPEQEIGSIMVECFPIQSHDVGAPAFMVRVALLAFRVGDILYFAVKTLAVSYVRSGFLVAGHAQARLFGLAEGFVALAAIGFEFGMAFDYGTRHYQFLQRGGHGDQREEQGQRE